MSNYNKIIKDKVEQFEVPFNEAHWAEMEARLNGVKSKNNRLLFGSAAAIITLVISSYFLFSTNTPTTLESTPKVESFKPTTPKVNINTPVLTEENLTIEENSIIKAEAKELKTISNDSKTKNKHVLKAKQENIVQPISIAESKPKETVEIDKNQIKEEIPLTKEKVNLEQDEIQETISPKKLTIEEPVNAKSEIIDETIQVTETPAKVPSTRKSIKPKAYEDENVTKKSVKRSGRRPFISFKKRLYKVPLSRKKSKKK